MLGIDADTGAETHRVPIGVQPFDAPLQLTGMVTPQGELWQATATRLLRIGADTSAGDAASSYPSGLSSSQLKFQ